MTISSTETKAIYGGNGSTSAFAIPFMFMRDEDIEITLTDIEGLESTLSISTDYQLSGAGEQTGGTCTMTTPPEAGQVVVIRRNPAIVQEVDYVENDAFPAATHEAALDKLTMICQALAERLDRTITFRVSSAVSGVELPEPESGRLLGWNDDGDDLANRDVGQLDNVLLPLSIGQGGTGAESAGVALANLGFGSAGISLAACADADAVKSYLAYDFTPYLRHDQTRSFSKSLNFTAITASESDGTVDWNLEDEQVRVTSLEANSTLANPSNQKAGATYIHIVKQDGTGGRTLAYGTDYKFPDGEAPELSTGANAVDILTFVSDGTSMYGVATLNFQ